MTMNGQSAILTSDERKNIFLRSPVRKNTDNILHSPFRFEKERMQAAAPTSPTSTAVLQMPRAFPVDTKSPPAFIPIRPVRGFCASKVPAIDTPSFSFDDDTSVEGGELLGLRCLDDIMDYSDDEGHAAKIVSDDLVEILTDDESYAADTEGKKPVDPE
jgi:hypothetical protein